MKSPIRPSFLRLVLIIAAGLVSVPRAPGQSPVYAYDSFGPGNTYNTGVGYGIVGASGSGGYQGHAEQFVPTLSGNLNSVEVALYLDAYPALNQVNFCVATDNGGIPGAVLESFPNEAGPGVNGTAGLLTMNSITQPLLQAGTTYWLYAEPARATTGLAWFVNTQGYANDFAAEGSPGTWYHNHLLQGANSVFAISVLPVPEPSTAALLIFGVAGLFVCQLQRRKAVRLLATPGKLRAGIDNKVTK